MPDSAPTNHFAQFVPPWGLRNAHVQSSLLSLSPLRLPVWRQSRVLRAAAVPMVIDCGNGVRLSALHSPQANKNAPWIILLHGWLGNANSSYVLSLGARLFTQGYNVVRLNLRDHGGSEALNPGLFHSCLLDEVIGAVRLLQTQFAIADLSLAGFSLGGNFALRVAARAGSAGIQLHKVVAICPALNPHASDAALASGPAMYRHYFLSKWKRSLRLKQQLFPDRYDFASFMHNNNITELTDVLVKRHADFAGVREYYDGYSLLGSTLAEVNVPSHILLADDDPIVPIVDVQHLAANPYLHIVRSQYGGHCGFIASWSGKRWVNDWALACLAV